ncbi:MAG TPA: hypothetical protein VHP32_05890 [Ignavibacteria bacterium]|nr:hypothetical protein [Ignavibacteria bacterium]
MLRNLHNAGFKVILNIKFNFEKRNLPVFDSEINSELSYLDTVLNVIYSDCDVLVCGNEPFIESKIDQRDSLLLNFYIAVAKKVKSYVDNQSRKVPLYIGAFDNLWKPSWQTESAIALINFARESQWINGIDLHIHHTLMEDIDSAFAFVSPKIRNDQKIIVTEFSLKNEWKLHLRDTIPNVLSIDFGKPADLEVYQYLNYTIHNPVSRDEWVTFLSKSPWFETRKNYLTEAWGKFNANPKFYMATYGLYQNAPEDFTPKTDPWIINPLFVNVTVIRDSITNHYQTNYAFFDEFVKIVK